MSNNLGKRIIKHQREKARRTGELYTERVLKKPNFSETSFGGPRSHFSKCVLFRRAYAGPVYKYSPEPKAPVKTLGTKK